MTNSETQNPNLKTQNPNPTPPARQRAAISNERRLSLLLASVVAVCDKAKLKDPAIDAARAVAKEVTEKVIKPITVKLEALRKELKGYDMATIAIEKLSETMKEIKRLEARKAVIDKQAAGV